MACGSGYRAQMGEMGEVSDGCAFAPCPHPAVETLPFLVEGDEVSLAACQLHADWLRAYAEEDPAVRVVDDLPRAVSD